ncbi:MAG TPA: hypothetical protein PLX97_08780 [Gemmatales bacterium]|nr:hypothetical protein [Gemmatales bacterium]
MKLVCPHCAKVIEMDDRLAGQSTNCTLCQGPLTVPYAPAAVVPPAPVPPAGPPTSPAPLPPPPPPPSVPDPLGTTTAWPPSSPTGNVIPPIPNSPSASAAGGGRGGLILGKLQDFSLPPGIHEWLGLGGLVLLFVLFFFPWVGVYIGDTRLVEQSGMAVGFGYASATDEGKFLTANLPGSGLVVLGFLGALAGLLLLIVLLVEKYVKSPAIQNIKPMLEKVIALQEVLVLGCLVLVSLVLLFHWIFFSFPLESAAWSEKANDTMLTGLRLKTEGIEKVKSADMVGLQWLQRRGWFYLALFIAIVATIWHGLRWLNAKGYTRHWPKVVIQWPTQAPQLTAEAAIKASDLTTR